MSRPTFAFLALEEHPYARVMLDQLLGAGFVPSLVVQEASDVAEVERDKFLERMAGHDLPGPIADQLRGLDVEEHSVAKHSSDSVLGLVDGRPLDLVVLGGTRILRGPLLDYPAHGVINSHPGLLPDCRGSASPAWSVLHDIPVGSTTHFCDNGIDTGDVLLRRAMEVRRGMTYEDLCYGTTLIAGELMREALQAFVAGRWPELRHPQGESPWPTFKNAPPEVIDKVRNKLQEESYVHYA